MECVRILKISSGIAFYSFTEISHFLQHATKVTTVEICLKTEHDLSEMKNNQAPGEDEIFK